MEKILGVVSANLIKARGYGSDIFWIDTQDNEEWVTVHYRVNFFRRSKKPRIGGFVLAKYPDGSLRGPYRISRSHEDARKVLRFLKKHYQLNIFFY